MLIWCMRVHRKDTTVREGVTRRGSTLSSARKRKDGDFPGTCLGLHVLGEHQCPSPKSRVQDLAHVGSRVVGSSDCRNNTPRRDYSSR